MRKLFLLPLLAVLTLSPKAHALDAEQISHDNMTAAGDTMNGLMDDGDLESNLTPAAKKSNKKFTKKKKSTKRPNSAQLAKAKLSYKCSQIIIAGKPGSEPSYCKEFRPFVESCFDRIRSRTRLSKGCQIIEKQNLQIAACKKRIRNGEALNPFCRQFKKPSFADETVSDVQELPGTAHVPAHRPYEESDDQTEPQPDASSGL